MAKKITSTTQVPKERAFLVGTQIKGNLSSFSVADSLAELSSLCDSAGLEIVGESKQLLAKPHTGTFIGSGKIEEINALVMETLADIIVFDNELSPRHLRELEERFDANIRVIDRTALILDIFGQHAHTREGILQVELAQYEYRLPRLTRAWTHLARQAGGSSGRSGGTGGVGLRGPGETQLEIDRREIRKRIGTLKTDLEKVRAHRSRYRKQRKVNQIPVISIVGYTNAGKSTLLNAISNAGVYTADQLFATLDPTTRKVKLPRGTQVLFSDTVGFIQKLPTQLIAAFRATLEEIAESELLIHVVDISHENAIAQWKSVNDTLQEIGAGHLPYLTLLNKVDQLPDPDSAITLLNDFPHAFAASAKTGYGLEKLLASIENSIFQRMQLINIILPYSEGKLISAFHEQGQVTKVENGKDFVKIEGYLPERFLADFKPFMRKTGKSTDI